MCQRKCGNCGGCAQLVSFQNALEWQEEHQIPDHLLLKAIEEYYRATFYSLMKESPHEVFLYAPCQSLSPEELELFQTMSFARRRMEKHSTSH
jgi:hypothetical protein